MNANVPSRPLMLDLPARQSCNGMAPSGLDAVLGDGEAGVALALGGALPWIAAHMRSQEHGSVAMKFLQVSGCARGVLV